MTYEEYCEKRDALGLSDYYISKLTKISRATFSQWKNGKTYLTDTTIKRLNYFFDNYEPDKIYAEGYFSVPFPPKKMVAAPHLKSLPFPPEFDDYENSDLTFRINSFNVDIPSQIPVELTSKEFRDLKEATQVYAHVWLKSHGKIE